MRVLIDTPVWSLALRRAPAALSAREQAIVQAWAALVRAGRAALIGPVRQEVLSGLRDPRTFDRLNDRLSDFEDLSLETGDYVQAAAFFNTCRSHGVTGSAVDLLICAAARRHSVPIFSTDTDFRRYARLLRVRLYSPRKPRQAGRGTNTAET